MQKKTIIIIVVIVIIIAAFAIWYYNTYVKTKNVSSASGNNSSALTASQVSNMSASDFAALTDAQKIQAYSMMPIGWQPATFVPIENKAKGSNATPLYTGK